MSIGLTLPLAAAAGAAIKSASNLEQSVGAIESVFGDAAARIEEFGRTAADQIGLSRREVNETASALGASLQSVGFSAIESADQVIVLQERAADMAATFGGTTKDALDAVASLMRGERDPIERYGVALNQAAIDAEVMALGLDTSTAAAERQAEATAAMSLLLEQTGPVQGQFARETDTAAGAQQRLQANVENLTAELGQNLLPIAEDVLEWANGAVGAFSALTEGQQRTVIAVAGVVAALGPLMSVGGRAVSAVADLSKALRTAATSGPQMASGMRAAATFLTGPWGLALGAATAAVGLLVLEHQRGEQEVREYTSAIQADSGALGENTRAHIANALEREGVLADAESLGIALDDVVDAVLGEGDALERVTAIYEENTAEVGNRTTIGSLFSDVMDDEAGAANSVRLAILGQNDAVNDAVARTSRLAEAVGESTEETQTSTTAWQRISDVLAGPVAAAAARATTEVDALAAALDENALGSIPDSMGLYQSALTELNTAARSHAEEVAGATENAEDSWEDYFTEVTADAGVYLQSLSDQVIETQRWAELIAEAQNRGLTLLAEQIRAAGPEQNELFTDLLLNEPLGVAQLAEQELAAQQAATIQAQLAALGENAPLLIDEYGRVSADAVAEFAEQLGLSPGIVAEALEESNLAASQRQEQFAETGGLLGSAIANNLNRAMRSGSAEAAQIARGYAQALADGVNPILASLGQGEIVIRSFGPGPGGVLMADGGVLEDHSAQIAPGGSWRVWAEPETGGEAYIPLAPSKRQRSIDIWKQTGQMLGVEHAEHFADGGFSSVDDVPGVPSVSPYRSMIGDPASAAMAHAREKSIAWLAENLAPILGPGIGYEAMFAAISKLVPGTYLMSGFRPGAITATGNPSYHGKGRAVDLGFGSYSARPTPGMGRIAHAIRDNYMPSTKELIYSDPAFPEIRNGRNHDYTGITRAMHYNHVHWAMANGGIVPAQRGGTPILVGEAGQDEAIIPLDNGAIDVNIVGYGPGSNNIGSPDGMTWGLPGGSVPTLGAPTIGTPNGLGLIPGLDPFGDPFDRGVRPQGPPPTPALSDQAISQIRAEEIAANMEEARINGLSAAERLAEVEAAMGELVPYTDEWVVLLREAERLEDQLARSTEQVATETARASATAMADLNRLLDTRDRIQGQMDMAARQHAERSSDINRQYAASLDQAVESRLSALDGFAAIDQRFQPMWANTASALARNIEAQADAALEAFAGVDELRSRGLSEDVIGALNLDDPAQLGQIQRLLRESDTSLSTLNDAYAGRERVLSDRVATEQAMRIGDFGSQVESIMEARNEALAEVDADLRTQMDELREEMAAVGSDTGRGIADAMAQGLASGIPGIVAAAQAAASAAQAAARSVAQSVTTIAERPPMAGASMELVLDNGERLSGWVQGQARTAAREDSYQSRLAGLRG